MTLAKFFKSAIDSIGLNGAATGSNSQKGRLPIWNARSELMADRNRSKRREIDSKRFFPYTAESKV